MTALNVPAAASARWRVESKPPGGGRRTADKEVVVGGEDRDVPALVGVDLLVTVASAAGRPSVLTEVEPGTTNAAADCAANDATTAKARSLMSR